MQTDPNLKMSRIQYFLSNLSAVLSSRRFWTVQGVLMLLIESAVIINFACANHSLYDGFIYFWFNLLLLCITVIIVNATACATLYRCHNGFHFLGYLLIYYFVATLPCSVIQMIVYSNFNALGFLNTEAGLITLFLLFAVITSLFYKYLYDYKLSIYKYPAYLSIFGRVVSVFVITASILISGFLYLWCSMIDYFEGWDEFLKTNFVELSTETLQNNAQIPNTFVIDSNATPKHNEDISIYVDFSQSSANKRFVVYDNKKKQVIATSKCAHGAGKGSTVDNPVFSNEIGSNCSSLGEYRVAEVGKMTNGFPCIRLDGLNKTNSNARKRGVAIHELPIFTSPIFDGMKIPLNKYISSGCFAISPEVFELLTNLRKEGKTIYIYATK